MSERELYENLQEAYREMFLQYVGFKKFISFDELAERLKKHKPAITVSTLRDLSQGKHGGSVIHLLQILDELPDEATSKIFKLIGYEAHPITTESVCPFEVKEALSDAGHHIDTSLKDDAHMCKKEWWKGRPKFHRVVALCQRLGLAPPERKFMPYQPAPWREAGD